MFLGFKLESRIKHLKRVQFEERKPPLPNFQPQKEFKKKTPNKLKSRLMDKINEEKKMLKKEKLSVVLHLGPSFSP